MAEIPPTTSPIVANAHTSDRNEFNRELDAVVPPSASAEQAKVEPLSTGDAQSPQPPVIRALTPMEKLEMSVPALRTGREFVEGLVNTGAKELRTKDLESLDDLKPGARRTGQALGEVIGAVPPGLAVDLLRGANAVPLDGGEKLAWAAGGAVFEAAGTVAALRHVDSFTPDGLKTLKQTAIDFAKDHGLERFPPRGWHHDAFHTSTGLGTDVADEAMQYGVETAALQYIKTGEVDVKNIGSGVDAVISRIRGGDGTVRGFEPGTKGFGEVINDLANQGIDYARKMMIYWGEPVAPYIKANSDDASDKILAFKPHQHGNLPALHQMPDLTPEQIELADDMLDQYRRTVLQNPNTK